MNELCQELMLVFDRQHQLFTSYVGAPWVPLCEEISTAQRAALAVADVQGLCPIGADQITPSNVGPYAVLVFCWGGERGLLEGFLSEEPLTAVEQAVVDAALAAVSSWEVAWPQRPALLPSRDAEPAPFTSYTMLPAVACPARHPLQVLTLGYCERCSEAIRCSAIWPTRCAVCRADRRQALALMEQQGCICPICLPLLQDQIGQPPVGGRGYADAS
jgi:hypothetical protein